MEEPKPRLKKETLKERFQFHWIGIRVLFYIAEIGVPFFVDALCGHMWGTAAAVANVVIWFYFGLKARMAPGSRMLWLAALAFVIIVGVVELRFLFTGK